jgi:hypothetical protein
MDPNPINGAPSVEGTEQPQQHNEPAVVDIPMPAGVTLVPVEIENSDHPWCEIRLSDGNKLRIQVVVQAVWRVEGQGQDGPAGMPNYQMKHAVLVQAFRRKKRK